MKMLDKRNLSQFVECGGITDQMVKFIQFVHLKSQVINPELVSEEKEYAANEFIMLGNKAIIDRTRDTDFYVENPCGKNHGRQPAIFTV
jgi:hypothetical protein